MVQRFLYVLKTAVFVIPINVRTDLFTSAMVIILAELCPTVLSNVAPEALDASWQKCQHTLELMSSYNIAAQKCKETLNAMRQKAAPNVSSKVGQLTSFFDVTNIS